MENVRLYDELQTQISHLKKAQVQLEKSARLAGIGQLAAGIAHEINNPLAAILGFSELLHQAVGDDLKGDVEIILKEAQRVRDIVHGLLDFARQREPHKELADLNQIMQDTLKLYRYQLNKARVRTHEACDPTLPPVEVDPNQIKQVLLNLFTNAAQAMPQGGNLYLSTHVNAHAEISLTVRDTGMGIAPEHLPHIFEPFFTTKDVGQGSGLGLAISFGIMQNHGGRIEVESQSGQGSSFKLYLPAAIFITDDSNNHALND
jgi:two-component system NtrC family sensor kinase